VSTIPHSGPSPLIISEPRVPNFPGAPDHDGERAPLRVQLARGAPFVVCSFPSLFSILTPQIKGWTSPTLLFIALSLLVPRLRGIAACEPYARAGHNSRFSPGPPP